MRATLAIAALLLSDSLAVGQQVLYVKADAIGAADGTSWEHAYTDLQDALDFAREHIDQGPFEIWVAAGTYTPDRGSGDRWASFDLLSNVAVYGGFAGWEYYRPQRDPERNQTILNGDLLGNDDPDFVSESTCCYVTNEPGCDDPACEQAVCASSPRCCSYWHQGCEALARLYCCQRCAPTRCDNSYSVVTAIETDGTAVLDGFSLTGGEANRPRQDGEPDSRTYHGGALFARYSDFEMRNCLVVGNAGTGASGVYSVVGGPSVSRCIFDENFSYIGGPAAGFVGGEPTISSSAFSDNYGTGLQTTGSQPITGCRFIGNSSVGLTLSSGSPNIIDCTFSDNAGGMYASSSTYVQLINCGFFGNSAPIMGGGILSDGPMILLNCVFAGNSAGGWVSHPGAPPSLGWGGAIVSELAPALLLNCAVVRNSADGAAGMEGAGDATIAHSIFWGNTDAHGTDERAQLRYYSDNPPVVRYSDIQGWTGELGGLGNIDVDPLFVDPDGPDDIPGTEDDNFRLSMESPLINAGDPNPPLLQRWDGDRHFRKLYGRVDIGAYEFGIGDFNWDRVADLADFSAWESCLTGPVGDIPYPDPCNAFDFDGDADVDLTDYAGFQRECGTVHTIERPKRISPFHRQ